MWLWSLLSLLRCLSRLWSRPNPDHNNYSLVVVHHSRATVPPPHLSSRLLPLLLQPATQPRLQLHRNQHKPASPQHQTLNVQELKTTKFLHLLTHPELHSATQSKLQLAMTLSLPLGLHSQHNHLKLQSALHCIPSTCVVQDCQLCWR